jgi:predicted PurR-regulated permease PerM
MLTATVVSVVLVVTLYWAQSVFIPLALAAFLTFLLSPLVAWFRQHGLARTPAVILVVVLAGLVLGSTGWLVTAQITGLFHELPRYTQNLKDKVKSVKRVAANSRPLAKMISEINQELSAGPGPDRSSPEAKADGARGDDSQFQEQRPAAVILEPRRPDWLARLASFLSPLVEYFGELALAIILVIFMLLKREELRNRIIRLAGPGKIVTATKFVDEAALRVSRFLLLQAIINGTFGLLLGLGLLAIGVRYALLWGFLGAILRYLPFIGPYLAAVFPISLTLAMSEGWQATVLVLVLFLVLELTIANFVEPRLYGRSMGVSEIALLVSAAFWAFLWGPIGLVLSSPMTVCLVVLGRYSPQLEFLAVLLGDEPALDSRTSFYQRLLARDQDEAEDLILEQLKSGRPPEDLYDAMLLPTLNSLKRNRVRDEISAEDERFALRAIREIAEDLGERRPAALPLAETSAHSAEPSADPPLPIVACAARDIEDEVAVEMLARLLDPARFSLERTACGTLTGELLELVDKKRPALVCIAAMPPGGLAHVRYLCKRLRNRFPELKIVVGRWEQPPAIPNSERIPEPGGVSAARVLSAAEYKRVPGDTANANRGPVAESLLEAGASLVSTTLLETRRQLESLLPILAQKRSRTGARGESAGHPEIGDLTPGRDAPGRRASDRRMAAGGRIA